MSASPPDPSAYIFSRNYRSSIRLNYQHTLLTNLTGNQLLHQAIRDKIDLSASLHVADIGAGTAIWSTELAESLPETNCRIDAFDISTAQYPVAAWVRPAVTLYQHDAFQPFPEKCRGMYDIVNVRFFITLLSKEKLETFLQNVMSLLKPGGFFQWLDLDPRSAHAISAYADSPGTQTWAVAGMMKTHPPDVTSWITDDCAMIESAGFIPVAYDRLHLKNSQRPLWNHCVLMGIEEVCLGLEAIKADAANMQAMRKQLENLSSEFQNGAGVDAEWFYLVGRRPL
ncbi:hypothetical protein N7466_011414 [Penicillium verhagenii]|uniref:uncharacterized protein n=1 Tax=Penicillium verhagenii TaxID=1562060 RepID=UPI00254577FF|nr:uncharacterized protein N7466_011414 [Penicillium verhagenii]KAJ5915481.1 hypothetical protein N7466_011414 [Penicillium verhagenii]